ncbi:MAG: hypothetical protein R3D30_12330 [Hyphomicrobiales bacterium]
MDLDDTIAMLDKPEVRQLILGRYEGAYSLGVTIDPEGPQKYAIQLRIAGEPPPEIPDRVTIGDTTVRVIVRGNYETPVMI